MSFPGSNDSAPRDPGPRTARGGRQELIAEVVAGREVLVQGCWAHGLWHGGSLKTLDGQTLEVLFPGWLNRNAGPDFRQARVRIGGTEHFGDVEIHVDESEWWAHGHDTDPAYGAVVLHVVLRHGTRRAELPQAGGKIPVFNAGAYLAPQVRDLLHEPERLLADYERLPGRCGLRAALADSEAVARVVAHAAEARARDKAERLTPRLSVNGAGGGSGDSSAGRQDEQVLLETVCHYLGYRSNAAGFEALAQRFPLEALYPLLELPYPQAREAVLARWFGVGGLLKAQQPTLADAEAASEYHALRTHWLALEQPALERPLMRGGGRPWNAPERRLIGLFHHLYGTAREGWLKGWLGFLYRLDAIRDEAGLRREAIAELQQRFDTPRWEPWRYRVGFSVPIQQRPARLIGPDRLIILMANAVLPFFLARARRDGDVELEKLLYRLYLVLPPEGSNQRIRFMERRLGPVLNLRRTLRSHQGLLQIHQDFCTSFNEGCERCGLPDLIGPSSSAVAPEQPSP